MLMHRRTDDLEVIGYSDADFDGRVDSQKLRFGYIFLLVDGGVKQTLNATSTMEVELVSCFEASSHGVWLRSFIFDLELWILYLSH